MKSLLKDGFYTTNFPYNMNDLCNPNSKSLKSIGYNLNRSQVQFSRNNIRYSSFFLPFCINDSQSDWFNITSATQTMNDWIIEIMSTSLGYENFKMIFDKYQVFLSLCVVQFSSFPLMGPTDFLNKDEINHICFSNSLEPLINNIILTLASPIKLRQSCIPDDCRLVSITPTNNQSIVLGSLKLQEILNINHDWINPTSSLNSKYCIYLFCSIALKNLYPTEIRNFQKNKRKKSMYNSKIDDSSQKNLIRDIQMNSIFVSSENNQITCTENFSLKCNNCCKIIWIKATGKELDVNEVISIAEATMYEGSLLEQQDSTNSNTEDLSVLKCNKKSILNLHKKKTNLDYAIVFGEVINGSYQIKYISGIYMIYLLHTYRYWASISKYHLL